MACIDKEHSVPEGLADWFRYSARDLKKRLTPDPAGVSQPIKLMEDRDVVVGRLESAADLMKDALENDDDKTQGAGCYGKPVLEIRRPPD